MQKLSDELKYFFSGSIFLGASSMYSLIIPVVIIPYLIKTVGLSNYGLTVIAFSTTFFMSLIIDFGYNISGVNSLSKAKTNIEKNTIIVAATITKAIIFLIIVGSFLLVFYLIPYTRKHTTLFLYSLIIPFSSIFNFNWILQGLQEIKLLSIISVVNKTLYLLGLLFFVTSNYDYVYVNLLFGAAILVSGLIAMFFINREINISFIRYKRSDFIKEIKSSSHYFVSNMSIYLSANIYPLILSFFTSSEIVGIFSTIEKIYNLLRSVFSIYINLMLPRVSYWIENSLNKAKDVILKTYVYVILFILLELFFVYIFKKEIIEFFVDDYTYLSIDLLQIVSFGLLITLFNSPIYLILLAQERKKEIMKTFLLGPVIGIVLCFLLSKYYGIKGTIITVLCVELFYAISLNLLFYVRKSIFRKRR